MPVLRSATLILLFFGLSSAALQALDRQPNATYRARREALARELHGRVALLFGNYEPKMEYQDFRQDEDFYYLTGWNEPGAALIVAERPQSAATSPPCPTARCCCCPSAICAKSSTRA